MIKLILISIGIVAILCAVLFRVISDNLDFISKRMDDLENKANEKE